MGFAEDLNAVVKNDTYLADLINKEAKSLTFREQEEQEGFAEGLLSGAQDVLGGAVSGVGSVITTGLKSLARTTDTLVAGKGVSVANTIGENFLGEAASGLQKAIGETMTRSANYHDELVNALKNNTNFI